MAMDSNQVRHVHDDTGNQEHEERTGTRKGTHLRHGRGHRKEDDGRSPTRGRKGRKDRGRSDRSEFVLPVRSDPRGRAPDTEWSNRNGFVEQREVEVWERANHESPAGTNRNQRDPPGRERETNTRSRTDRCRRGWMRVGRDSSCSRWNGTDPGG